MGYDLHITRRKDWSEDGNDIAKEEFVAYVQKDTEFIYPGENGNDYADWKSTKSGYESWLCWEDGRVHTKNPEPEFVDKVVAIAKALGAKAQGDDGEVYSSATTVSKDEEDAEPAPVVAAQVPFWKLLLGAFLLGCVLLTLKLLLFK